MNRLYLFSLVLIHLFCSLVHAQTISNVNADGNLLVEGNTFLPIGFYCDGINMPSNPNLPQDMWDDHFNTLITETYSISIPEYEVFLDACDVLGIKNVILLPLYSQNSDGFSNYINALKTSSSVIAWNILAAANQYEVAVIETQKSELLELDTNRVSLADFGNLTPPYLYMLDYVETASFYQAPWQYPWGIPQDLDLAAFRYRQHALTCKEKGIFPIVEAQTHNFAGTTFPSPSHLDAQSYLGFVAGNKGLFYYSFLDYDNNQTINNTQPALYAAASKVAEEVLQSELRNVFLFGEHEYSNPAPDQHIATWEYEDKLYIIAVNSSGENSSYFDISLPSNIIGEIVNYFPDRSNSLTIQDESLQGSLMPYQVVVYQMQLEDLGLSQFKTTVVKAVPNPVEESFILLGASSDFSYSIYSVSGIFMESEDNVMENTSIDISHFPSGIYILRYQEKLNSISHQVKIIKF